MVPREIKNSNGRLELCIRLSFFFSTVLEAFFQGVGKEGIILHLYRSVTPGSRLPGLAGGTCWPSSAGISSLHFKKAVPVVLSAWPTGHHARSGPRLLPGAEVLHHPETIHCACLVIQDILVELLLKSSAEQTERCIQITRYWHEGTTWMSQRRT